MDTFIEIGLLSYFISEQSLLLIPKLPCVNFLNMYFNFSLIDHFEDKAKCN